MFSEERWPATCVRGVGLINPQEDRVMMRNLMLMMEDFMHDQMSWGLAVGHVKRSEVIMTNCKQTVQDQQLTWVGR